MTEVLDAIAEVERMCDLQGFAKQFPCLSKQYDEWRSAYKSFLGRGADGDLVKDSGTNVLRLCQLIRSYAFRTHPGRSFYDKKLSAEVRSRIMRSDEFKEWYRLYLQSSDWHSVRDRVFARSNFKCEGCGDAEATEVHHRSYDNVGYEFLFELVAVCRECHERIHGR